MTEDVQHIKNIQIKLRKKENHLYRFVSPFDMSLSLSMLKVSFHTK